ncbi:sigma-70 family RNA polymerase sigma factor [Tautonia rosea]|uniref:sigma-70 family RNA polymerase sigma factor n=1 Tax=Tautonia rosea TaxID=2728037 RepID=UPI0014763530|nr:sigma-70 family RNA polymerase sigma factor [Tautonia rosea]
MAGNRSKLAGSDWRTLFRLGTMGDWSDGRLLDRFLQQPDDGGDAAFETLVRRHGPMVWRVCRGVLADRHAAEDAYQATFLVLAERARSIRRRDSVASWLYGVARRISLRSLADARSRRDSERRAARPEAVAVPPLADAPGDLEALLRELDRLPAHYRGPIALHDLGGCSYEEVASRLGCPVGTIKARLNRGRALLRSRLAARGVSPTLPAPAALAGIVPNALTERTVRSAVSLLLGRAATGAGVASLSPTVAALSRGVIHAMFLAKLKTAAAALVLGTGLCAAGVAAVVAAQGSNPGNPPGPTISRLPSSAPNPSIRQQPALSPEAIDQRAEEIVEAIDDPERRAETLLRLGLARVQRGQTDAALDALLLARDAAEEIPEATRTTNPHPIIRIASAQALAGDRDAAKDTLREAVGVIEAMEQDLQLTEWDSLVWTWHKSLGPEGIETVIEPYRAFLERLPSGAPTEISNRLTAYSGKVAKALEELRTSAFFRNPLNTAKRRSALVNIVIVLKPEDGELINEALAQLRREARAAPEAPPGLHEADALAPPLPLPILAQLEAQLGRFEDALATIRAIEPTGKTHQVEQIKQSIAIGLARIASDQADAGHRDDALESLAEALRIVRTIEDWGLKRNVMESITELYLKLNAFESSDPLIAELIDRGSQFDQFALAEIKRDAGDEDGALRYFREALDKEETTFRSLLARRSPDERHSVPRDVLSNTYNLLHRTAANIARARLELDGVEAAIRTVTDLPEEEREEFLPELAEALARGRALDAAGEVIRSIEDPELRDLAIVRVALAMPGPSEAEPPTDPEPAEAP